MLTNLTPPHASAARLGAPAEATSRSICLAHLDLRSSVVLAPLSGITDVPFRALVRSFGTELVYSEMVASGEILRGNAESRLRAAADGDGLHAVQLAGREPRSMREAAALVAGEGADLIDINMGCPAKKVVGGLSGAALMRDLDHALRVVEATVAGAGKIPVTLKMRLGWDRSTLNAPDLARRAEAAGVQLLTVHGRTRDQFYEGHADWAAIADVKRAVSIPVIANGDLVEAQQELPMRLASGADAVMVGRGACGRPWFPAMVGGTMPDRLWRQRFCELVAGHHDAMIRHYGASVGIRHARKHLGWYLDRFAAATAADLSADRVALLRESDPARVARQIRRLFADATIADVDHVAGALQKAA